MYAIEGIERMQHIFTENARKAIITGKEAPIKYLLKIELYEKHKKKAYNELIYIFTRRLAMSRILFINSNNRSKITTSL